MRQQTLAVSALALLCCLTLSLTGCKEDPPPPGNPDSGTPGPAPDAGRPDAGFDGGTTLPPDGGDPTADAGTDAGTTPPPDGGSDGGITPPPDGGSDGGVTPPPDAGTDGGTPPQACGDFIEDNVLTRWTATAEGNAQTNLSTLGPPDVIRGTTSLRAVTQAPFDFSLNYTPAGGSMDVSSSAQLRFAIRALNTTPIGWQGNFPVVVLQDAGGKRRTYTPSRQLLGRDGTTWTPISVPLAGDTTWSISGDTVNLAALARVEVHADTWDSGFTIDLDAMSFEQAQTVCALQCPNACSGRGTCDSSVLACTCDLGYGGSACNTCAPGFVPQGNALRAAQ